VTATLQLTHGAIGVEVRRGTYEVVLDGQRVGSVSMNDAFEMPVATGHHVLQVRSGRRSSRPEAFDAVDGAIIAYRCTGKNILPLFLLSFVVPSLALVLRRQ
jgi:hypothetical protein